MGCKNGREKGCQDVNPFDLAQQRSESRRNATPRSRSSSRGTSVTHGERSADEEAPGSPAVRYPVTEVPIVFSRFKSLPSGAIKRSVFSVYDGDTITLRGKDNAKVRLLAMDTPEVQDKEPYALEARDFVAKYLLKKPIYLVFEGQEKDRYGRFLAHVYAKDMSVPPFKYICVNLAVVEVGLANFYHPQGTPLVLDDLFLRAQASARKQKLHIWKDVCEDMIVYLTAHGQAFHKKSCRSIAHVPLTSLIMHEALDQGHYPCRDCHPNWASKAACAAAHSAHSKNAAVVKKPVSSAEVDTLADGSAAAVAAQPERADEAPLADEAPPADAAIADQSPSTDAANATHEPTSDAAMSDVVLAADSTATGDVEQKEPIEATKD